MCVFSAAVTREKEKKKTPKAATPLSARSQAWLDKTAREVYHDVATRRLSKDKIVRVIPSKRKEGSWTLSITREGCAPDPGFDMGEICKLGYTEWLEMVILLSKSKSELLLRSGHL